MAISALQIRVWLFRHYKYVHVGNETAAAAVATALCVAILLLFLLLLAAAVCHRTPTTPRLFFIPTAQYSSYFGQAFSITNENAFRSTSLGNI